MVGYTVSNISNGALFSVAPVVAANGTLTYTPAANVNGVSTFDVVVQDDGGTANGGVDTSAPQSFTIHYHRRCGERRALVHQGHGSDGE